MITLTFAVIANLFFGQVTEPLGLRRHQRHPDADLLGSADAHPEPPLLRRARLSRSLVYAVLRYVVRTPFGLTLQGIRDDPVRMSSLGYNVALHRTLAFAFAGFVAAIGGVLFVWWNGHIDPAVDRPRRDDRRARDRRDRRPLPARGRVARRARVRASSTTTPQQIGFIGPRFHTLIGAIFLVIVLVSPGGLIGLWERVARRSSRRRRRRPGRADRRVAAVSRGRTDV